MSYPDLVAFMKQENTPPGASFTLDQWIENTSINDTSFLLDLACSTGFSSRYCHERVGALGKGIDLSAKAIEVANERVERLEASQRIIYQVADACALPYDDGTFTHVLGGCNFAFIQDRQTALAECKRVLKVGGTICVSNYYYTSVPPTTVLDEVERSLGWRPESCWNYDYWHAFFASEGFVLGLDLRMRLEVLSDEKLLESIQHYIRHENPHTRALGSDVQNDLIVHFHSIRKSLNQQRNYQGVAVQSWHR